MKNFLDDRDKLMEILKKIDKLRNEGRLKIALLALEGLMPEYPDLPEVLNLMAEIKYQMGHKEDARNIFLEILEKFPDYSRALNNLGVIYFNDHYTEKALYYFKKSLKINPDDSSTVLNLGDLLISLEKYEETRDLYTGYLERNKNDREIRKRLEMLYDRLIPLHTDNVNKPFLMKEREYWNVNDIYEAMFKRVVTDENIDKMTFEERMKAWDSSAISSSNRIIQGLPVKPEWKILEIGCGVGRVIKPLRAKFAHVDGVDIAENMIEFARQYLADCSHNGNVYVNSGSDLGMFSDNTYDLVYSMIVFQHIRSISVVRNYFNEIFRVLKPGGYFRLQVHQWESNFGKYDDEALPDRQYALDGNGYTPEQLNLLFSEQQFNEIDIIREGKWLWATAKKSADILDSFTVSAIVSTYNSEMFIRGCLEDLVEQTLYRKGQMEIIIVDTGSEQKEGAIVREFQDKYGRNNIRYIRTEDRKTLYEAWNTGIKEARGKYITNANTDDRHRFDALEIMSDYLDRNQDVALVYADQLITTIPNETFSDTKAKLRWNWPEFSYEELETRCIIGPQPVWRKELHNKYGYFRGDFKSAGDYEFWLRIGKYEKIRLIPELLGLYYENRQGLERASYASDKETDLVRTEYGMKKRGIPAKATIPASVSSDDLANCKKNVFIDKHLVSVIIPSYNHGCYLYESVESVVNQTYSNIEIIIINDGSSDDTKVIANALMSEHKNIRFFDREHEGIVNTRNFGLFVSSGKYILFLDGDDKIHPDFLKETVAILDSKPSVGFVYTAVQHIGIRTDIWSGGEFNPQKFLRENQLTCTALFRREIFEQTGGMKPVMEDGYEDWEFWISAYEKGWHGYLLDKPYFYYRKINNISRLGKLYQNQLLENVLKARIINLHRELYSPSELDWAKNILNKIEKPSINKVLIIHHNKTSFSPDGIHSGAEMATIHLARALVLLGLDVKVYAVLTEEPGLYDGVDYRHYASNEELSAIINSLSEPVDLMLTLSVEVLTYTGGKKHIKTRAYWMQNPANSYTDNVEILNNTDLIVYVSHHQMECAEKIGIMTKGIVLYNGFFEHIFHPSSLNYNPYQITYAGAIVPQKGVHILINAFPLIQKEFPEARLFICGTSAFWGHKSYIDIEHIEKTNHSIKFLGAVSQKDLAIIFQQSAIGVIPTDKKIWEDPFPLTSIEMQACGCPVVVSRAGGLPEGILEHETGFIVDSDNPADWSDRIISLLKDRSGLENMREKAYHSVYNRFRWTKLAKNLLELVKDVTSVNIEPEESINKAIIHDRSTVICEKIAFLSTYNQACGIATHTGFIYDALKKELKRYPQYDGEIIILAQKDVKLVTEDEPNVIRCWKKGTSDSKENFHHLIHVIKEKKITILHIQFQDGLLADTDIVNLVNICRNMNIKVFITFHSSEVALPLCAELINASNCSFVHLEQSLMRFVMAGANPELIRIVPHGVIDDLQSALSLNEARVKAGISSELKVISSFGFLDPHKGVLEIIRALPEILKKHNVIFIFIGGGHPNNPERDVYPKKCKEEAIHSGISERVYFVEGFLPQETVSLYLSASDVIVMNYTINRNEASGAAAFALAHRRPLITNSMPPFKPLVNCTLQTSEFVGLGQAISYVLGNKKFSDYLIGQINDYIENNSYGKLAQILINMYGMSSGQLVKVPVIGIDIRTLLSSMSTARGIGHYTINHLNALIAQTPQWRYILYLDLLDSIEQNNYIATLLKYPNVELKSFLDASYDDADIFHIPDPMNMSSGFDSPFLRIRGKNTTVLFHDLIPLVLKYINSWDYGAKAAYNTRLEQLKRSKAFILTNSEYTRFDLNKYQNIPLERMKAVMAGLNCAITHRSYTRKQIEETLRKYNLREPFFLYVGALDPHKNFVATANALIAMNKTKKYTSQLAVIGKFDPYTRSFKEQLEAQGVKEIIFTDFVPREELEQLYSLAVALVFPSQYEGFGFPVLEAMANGCPVITSNVTSIPEVAGDAALLFDPSDINGIAGAMLFLIENKDERAQLIEKGYKQAQKFTWEKTAARTIEVWEEILNRGNGLKESKKRIPNWHGSENYPVIKPDEFIVEGETKKAEVFSVPLLWFAPFFNPSGYTSEAFAFVRGLVDKTYLSIANISNIHSQGFIDGLTDELKRILKNNITEKPDVKNKIVICHFPAYAFSRDKESLYTIGRTMFETDRIPSDWVDKCNLMDEIWVPSKFNFHTFHDAGVKKEKLVIMPEPVDTDFFNPDGVEPCKIEGKAGFNFLSVFEWSQRKGWPILLEAYFREFTHKDNVCLFLKTYLLHKPDKDVKKELKERIISFAESIKLDIHKLPKFELITQQLPFKDLPSFYKAFDCLVIPSHGEGWGRPHCEAMSMELPVIATNWSGNTEFMNKDNSYLIDVEELVDIKDTEIQFYQGHRWAKPSVRHLGELMRHVYENPEMAKEKGRKARHDMIASYSCEVIGNKVLSRLNEIKGIINKKQEIRGMTDLKIFWEGSQFVYHSLALINRELCLQLIDRGLDVTIIPYENHQFKADVDTRFRKISERLTTTISRPADIHVRHQWPPKFTAPPGGGHWVIIQPWEYGRLRKEWVEPMRDLIDEIWIPSNFVRKTYIESGIQPEKVFVIPNGFNPEIFNPSVKPFPVKTDKKFKFLFVGGTIWRKGADVLVNAYIKTFTALDDVSLIIKDIGHDSFYKGMGIGEQLKKIQDNPSMPEIIYIKDFLSEKEMAGLYTACDCLLHPYRGEGFAFPVLEAMACGKPVIVTKGGATDDFCKEEFTFHVSAEWIKITFPDMELAGGEGMVLEPSMDSLIKNMRDLYENYPSAMEKAARALEFVKSHYTWDKIGNILIERINKLRNKPVLRHEKIKTLMKRGEMFFTDGNTDEAMKCFSTILDIEHSSGKTHSHMAALYWKRNDRVNALKHIKEAIKFSPCDSDVVWNYGHIMTERGQKSDAFKAYKEYLSKNPHDAEIKSLFDKLVKEEEIRKASSHEKKKKDKKKKKK